MIDADVVIAGAGCAGLSLAAQLSWLGHRGRVVLLDPRPTAALDRTWCHFLGAPHPYEQCIARTWDRWRMLGAGKVVERGSRARPYVHISTERFVETSLEACAKAGHEVRFGSHVMELDARRDHVRVETSEGVLCARLLIDARGARRSETARRDVSWVQHFVGWEVRTERPIFEPDVVTLMDLEVSQEAGPHFVYVLPFARDHALVEDTYFGEEPLDEEVYTDTLSRWLDEHGAGAIEILRVERGVIPMSTAPTTPSSSPRIVPLGIAGGSAKASTGYAFQFIQRHAAEVARAIVDGGDPPRVPAARSHVASFYDRVFLSYLRRHHREAPSLFTEMFARTSPDVLARFLSEEASALDHLAVMNSVPRLRVTAEVLRSSPLWMRSR